MDFSCAKKKERARPNRDEREGTEVNEVEGNRLGKKEYNPTRVGVRSRSLKNERATAKERARLGASFS
jgi:hypothetical protein